jgi:hypothetical protein
MKITFKLILIFLLIFNFSKAISQGSKMGYRITRAVVNFEYGIGAVFLSSNDISDNLGAGVNTAVGFRFNIPQKYIFFNFYGGLKIYNGNSNISSNYEENLQILKLGTQIHVNLYQSKNRLFSVYSYLDFGKIWSDYYYTQTIAGTLPMQPDETETFDIFDGKSYSLALGSRMYFHMFFLEISYEFINSKVNPDNTNITKFHLENSNYATNEKVNLSSSGIRIGITLPLGFLGRYKSVPFPR